MNKCSETQATSGARQGGVTLIELMVVMAIIAIIAAIAYPSYQAQIRMSRRAAAQAFLMDVAARQHQWMLDVRSYAPDLATLKMTPPQEVNGFYAFTAPTVTASGFTLRATATGVQAKDSGCTALELSSAGQKSPLPCW